MHFGSYPSTLNNHPFQQYYGTLNAYPNAQRFGYGTSMSDGELGGQNMFGYSNSPFGPMFDYATNSNNEPESATTTQPPKVTTKETAKESKSTEQHDQKAPIESIFHIVKPNFASLKKVALMKKHRLVASKSTRKPETRPTPTTPLTTTNSPPSTTVSKSALISRKMAKIMIAKKSSTPAPKTTTLKRRDKTTESSTPRTSTTKLNTVKVITTTVGSKTRQKRSGFSDLE